MTGHDAKTAVTVSCYCGMSFSLNQSPHPELALNLARLLWDEHRKAHPEDTDRA